MNRNTATVIINLGVIILTGFTFYLTRSSWSFAILLILFKDDI